MQNLLIAPHQKDPHHPHLIHSLQVQPRWTLAVSHAHHSHSEVITITIYLLKAQSKTAVCPHQTFSEKSEEEKPIAETVSCI